MRILYISILIYLLLNSCENNKIKHNGLNIKTNDNMSIISFIKELSNLLSKKVIEISENLIIISNYTYSVINILILNNLKPYNHSILNGMVYI